MHGGTQNFSIIGGDYMKVYRIGIIVCYVILGVTVLLDIAFRFHGMLALPVCLFTSGVSLCFARKIANHKAEMKIAENYKEEVDKIMAESEDAVVSTLVDEEVSD